MSELRPSFHDAALLALVVSLPLSTPALAQGSFSAPPRNAVSGAALPPAANAWSSTALPPDYAGSASLKCLGTCVVFRTPSAVHLWSAITAAWTIVPVSPAAQVSQFNAFVLIQDGSTLHGWATRTGMLETLTFATPPSVHLGPLTSCWVAVALDGVEAWSFAAFDGTWRSQTLASSAPGVQLTQTTGLVDDGVTLFGLSAYHGGFVPAPRPPGANTGVVGDVALAWTPGLALGFSAHTNAWDERALAGGVLLAHERGYAMLQDGGEVVAFAGCTGDFALHALPAGAQWFPGAYVGAFAAGTQVTAYSSGQNAFATQAFASAPSMLVDDEVLAVQDTLGVRAFSVVTATFSDPVTGFGAPVTNDAVVWMGGAGQGSAFSPITGAWSASPALLPGAIVSVQRNVVVIADAQGYHGFSGRTGAWDSRTTQTAWDYVAPPASDVFAAFDGPRTLLFDPILSRWMETATAGPLLSQDVWRQTFVGRDGLRAHGYGLMNNAWSSVELEGTFQALDANSSAGFVATDTHLYTYSAHGSLSTLSRFPEFSRLQPVGQPLRLIQTAPAGSLVLTSVGLAATWQPFTALGTLYVDPASVLGTQFFGVVPTSGLLDAELDLSGFPTLQGQAVHVQNVVRPPGEDAHYSNLVAPVLL